MKKKKSNPLISGVSTHVNYARVSYCGECLMPIGGHWLVPVHVHDSSPLCPARTAAHPTGGRLQYAVDNATLRAIAVSGLDPRDSKNWEVVAAADGNKGYRKWRGAK